MRKSPSSVLTGPTTPSLASPTPAMIGSSLFFGGHQLPSLTATRWLTVLSLFVVLASLRGRLAFARADSRPPFPDTRTNHGQLLIIVKHDVLRVLDPAAWPTVDRHGEVILALKGSRRDLNGFAFHPVPRDPHFVQVRPGRGVGTPSTSSRCR